MSEIHRRGLNILDSRLFPTRTEVIAFLRSEEFLALSLSAAFAASTEILKSSPPAGHEQLRDVAFFATEDIALLISDALESPHLAFGREADLDCWEPSDRIGWLETLVAVANVMSIRHRGNMEELARRHIESLSGADPDAERGPATCGNA